MDAKQKTKSNWGGARKNAGAPGKSRPARKLPEEKLDRYYGTKVDDYLELWIEQQRRNNETDGELLRRLLTKMKESD